MRKLLTLMVAFFATINLLATDIIVTTNSQRIEAKIMEVSSTEIKYKEVSNPDGPTFVLSTNEINTIIYSNGTVKVFDHSVATRYNSQPVNRNSGNVVSNAALLPITRSNGVYYLGDQRMNEEQYIDFIRTNCREAWESHQSGNKLWKAGWSLFGVGTGLAIAGSVMCSVSAYDYARGRSRGTAIFIPGAVFCGLGSGFVTASIPCVIVGGVRKYNSQNVYNERCASNRQMAVTFGLQLSSNGIGLAMNF